MKTLPRITASAEQLPIISTNSTGAELIRGAAGSGKTTTALLRLRSLSNMMRARKVRQNDASPLKVLLLTFNRTLAGYVRILAQEQLQDRIEVKTFAKWARENLGEPAIYDREAGDVLNHYACVFPDLDTNYLIKEVDYLLGRFEYDSLENYVTAERTGRGTLPRVNASLRRRILDQIVYPYLARLKENQWLDWHGLAIKMRTDIACLNYDIIIVDESQDFSANQIRTIMHHLADEHSVTFVTDTAQRIYARGYTWVEAGVNIAPNRSHRLNQNHRNTKQIAAFAAGILEGVVVDADGALPNLDAATTKGALPKVITGLYNQQVDWSLAYIFKNVDLNVESVAFLKPQGGQWFSLIEQKLQGAGIGYVNLTRSPDWPEGGENVGLCTFHSAKGLEFDYVFILGFNQENTQHGEEEANDEIRVLRNLLAVAVARARKHVIVGYKQGEQSRLIQYFVANTFEQIIL
ncbi:MAG: 3'-5' exonuclease [Sedimenticola sp.]